LSSIQICFINRIFSWPIFYVFLKLTIASGRYCARILVPCFAWGHRYHRRTESLTLCSFIHKDEKLETNWSFLLSSINCKQINKEVRICSLISSWYLHIGGQRAPYGGRSPLLHIHIHIDVICLRWRVSPWDVKPENLELEEGHYTMFVWQYSVMKDRIEDKISLWRFQSMSGEVTWPHPSSDDVWGLSWKIFNQKEHERGRTQDRLLSSPLSQKYVEMPKYLMSWNIYQ